MELLLRSIQFFVKILHIICYPILYWYPCKKSEHVLPPIKNPLLTLSVMQLIRLLKSHELKSKELVQAYIDRIQEVNPLINAIVEHRFEKALEDAERADNIISSCPIEDTEALFEKYPILGIPFTVKEACGVKGMSHVVGSLKRLQKKAQCDCVAAERLRSAGGIILLVSSTPEYCFSIETYSLTNGRCLNPYDFKRTSGGSSGGEGSLNASGASVFGIGSDIAGSIRIPCLFNGLFGHKPTGGLISNLGHFPNSDDPNCGQFLQMGPITRFASDLGLLLHIMVGPHADELNFLTPVDIKAIKIFYSYGFDGLNGLLHQAVFSDIEFVITQAIAYFRNIGVSTKQAEIKRFRNSMEIALSGIGRLQNFPYLMTNDCKPPSVMENIKAIIESLLIPCGYTKEALMFDLMRSTKAFMGARNMAKYEEETELLKQEIISLLGPDGVLIFPTLHVSAIYHNSSLLPLWGIDYCLIFNILGLPCTHIPMGLNKTGLPVGFQVVAAPNCDRLCLQIASQLEQGFGGWQPPTKHVFA